MKKITKISVEEDFRVLQQLCSKYKEAIFENQEGQPAHFDNQSKAVRLTMGNIHCGLVIARDGLNFLSGMGIIED